MTNVLRETNNFWCNQFICRHHLSTVLLLKNPHWWMSKKKLTKTHWRFYVENLVYSTHHHLYNFTWDEAKSSVDILQTQTLLLLITDLPFEESVKLINEKKLFSFVWMKWKTFEENRKSNDRWWISLFNYLLFAPNRTCKSIQSLKQI